MKEKLSLKKAVCIGTALLGLSVAMLFPFVLFTDGFSFLSITGNTIILMLVLGIVHGGVGFYLFFAGMKGLKGQSIAVLSYIDPLTSLLISALVLAERMTLQQLLGAVLLLGSIWIGEAGRERRRGG
ncbi:DMT family transporter [Paenibacillus sp. FSL R10-2782]|uniref:DMT family transporter n=1 Tax=Paenibacillus sp. FSL R10-2782 TaxID=2954661 RepID=UPI0031595524